MLDRVEKRLVSTSSDEPESMQLIGSFWDAQACTKTPCTLYLELTPGTEVIPGYTLVSKLGTGGSGEVWLGKGPGDVCVAMKFIPPEANVDCQDDPTSDNKALEIIRQVRYPHLVPIHGIWSNKEYRLIISSLADKTLRDCLLAACQNGQQGIAVETLLPWFRDIAETLDFLNVTTEDTNKHPYSILHGDIKPENIFLSGGSILIGDLGQARILQEEGQGHSGSLTVSYAAPECLNGTMCKTSDQYSLAVTWCILRGGDFPYQGSLYEIIQQQGKDAALLATTAMDHCTVTDNSSRDGSGFYFYKGKLTLGDCTFCNNTVSRRGGVVINDGTATIDHCTISDNKAVDKNEETFAAGIFALDANAIITNCVLNNNSAQQGAGIFNVHSVMKVKNSLFACNTATVNGGAFGSVNEGNFEFTNCTITDNICNANKTNSDLLFQKTGSCTFKNCIVISRSPDTAIMKGKTTLTALSTLSTFKDWNTTASNKNIVYDPSRPLFVDAAKQDYRLAANSQGIDKGDNAYIADMPTDLTKDARVIKITSLISARMNTSRLVKLHLLSKSVNICVHLWFKNTTFYSGICQNHKPENIKRTKICPV